MRSWRGLLPNRQIFVNGDFAYLALAQIPQAVEICHMDKAPAPNRIREFREERDMTIEQLAEATHLSVSYVSRLESGGRNLSVGKLNLFAHALGVDPRDLLAEAPTEERRVIAVMGRIGAGAEILPEDEQVPPEGLYEIETPFPLPDDALAFEVTGESMWPRYDPGDIIICWKQGTNVEDVIGWEAAVKTSSGKRYLKRVLRGPTPHTYDLESHNAPPIRGVEIVWLAAIQSVIRSGQWTKLSASTRDRKSVV